MARGGGESKIVIFAAMAGNLGVAAIKFGAFAFTGSGAMLTEGVHSLVDTVDQVLLLVGQARGNRPPDARHPFGHGLEIYFWSFTVALMVFLAGGAAAVYEGVQRLLHPAPIENPWVNGGVLAVSFLFEGASLLVGVRAARKVIARATGDKEAVGMFAFISRSKDPSLYSTLVEDEGALIGLILAGLGVAGGAILHLPWADGAASIAIGVLLMGMAVVLANETRSLIAGEAVDPPVLEKMRKVLDEQGLCRATDIATLHFGPQSILVAITGRFVGDPSIESVARALTQALQAVDPRVKRVYFRPVPPETGNVAPPASGAA